MADLKTWGRGYEMNAALPILAKLGIYRISSEKQETFIRLLILSICGILGEIVCFAAELLYLETIDIFSSIFHKAVCSA